MTKQLLLAGPVTQVLKYRDWRTFCCAQEKGAGNEADVIIDIPAGKMSPLGVGLFALEKFELQAPLLVSTQSLSERLLDTLPDPDRAVASFSDPDTGYICFRTADDFVRCAKDAIRAHDPLKGEVSLLDVWQQALLKRLGE
ncbi:hypothetical protein EKN38_22405 [Enterobacter sp. WCHEn045836]|uniref:hypothetical protein n=1 Tax=Enterobacter sp. WCHEn045836 TaxID=2497434 RepID=UPI000F840F89|nr:hypothetical protein [Enterobacter sp. WCHEn045836]RTP97292.1 hypothetical protein EKN38_22405 [Enterobacter sp. WCHEn045836]